MKTTGHSMLNLTIGGGAFTMLDILPPGTTKLDLAKALIVLATAVFQFANFRMNRKAKKKIVEKTKPVV